MIVDSSVIVCILQDEEDAQIYLELLRRSGVSRLSAATFLETSIVIDRDRDPVVMASLDEFVQEFGLIVEPVTEAQARIARHAYREFGRGSGSPAQLNFGDCFSYALAMERNEPLLYKGSDFVHTDVRSATDEQ